MLSCNDGDTRQLSSKYLAEISHHSGERILVDVLVDESSKVKGLSGVTSTDSPAQKGAFFFYKEDDQKSFWMPDTYFNLDIIYLSKKLMILKIDKNVPHHPGYSEPPYIPKMNPFWCRHVLEVKSSSPFSRVIKPGDILTWKGKYSLKNISNLEEER